MIYPKTGVNIIDSKLVKYLKFEDNKVRIEVSMDETDNFKQNVVEEIKEHLDNIPDVKQVEIELIQY